MSNKMEVWTNVGTDITTCLTGNGLEYGFKYN